jgi:carbon storage regulator
MLILTRRKNEEIIIAKDIVVKILELSDGQVKIGIEAPREIQILRAEVYEKIKENTIEASSHSKIKPDENQNIKINKIYYKLL